MKITQARDHLVRHRKTIANYSKVVRSVLSDRHSRSLMCCTASLTSLVPLLPREIHNPPPLDMNQCRAFSRSIKPPNRKSPFPNSSSLSPQVHVPPLAPFEPVIPRDLGELYGREGGDAEVAETITAYLEGQILRSLSISGAVLRVCVRHSESAICLLLPLTLSGLQARRRTRSDASCGRCSGQTTTGGS